MNITGSCQSGVHSNTIHDQVVKQITQLPEYELAEMQLDFLKRAAGIPFELTIDVIDGSFNKEDSAKNVALAFINRGVEFEKKYCIQSSITKQVAR